MGKWSCSQAIISLNLRLLRNSNQKVFKESFCCVLNSSIATNLTVISPSNLRMAGNDSNFPSKSLGASGAHGGGGAGSYKPPFKNVEIVYISIKASLFEVKKRYAFLGKVLNQECILPIDPRVYLIPLHLHRVLGTNASAVLAISNEIGGQSRAVRIRMRGIGSGYVEGPSQQELQVWCDMRLHHY